MTDEPSVTWRSFKNSDGLMEYDAHESFSLNDPKAWDSTSYENRDEVIDAEAKVKITFNQEYRYTFPYQVRLEYSVGKTGAWKGYDDKTQFDRENAELGYVDVDFHDKESAMKFAQKAKTILGKLLRADSDRYLRREALAAIKERARSQSWGAKEGGTEARISRVLMLPSVRAREDLAAGVSQPDAAALQKVEEKEERPNPPIAVTTEDKWAQARLDE
jgi:hypothetical protein